MFEIGDQVKVKAGEYKDLSAKNKTAVIADGGKGTIVGIGFNYVVILTTDGTQIVTTENHIYMYDSMLENKITLIASDKGVGLTPDQVDGIYNTVLAEMRGPFVLADISMAEQIIAEEIEASIRPVATANGYDYWTWTNPEGEQIYNATPAGEPRPTGGYDSAAYICSIKKNSKPLQSMTMKVNAKILLDIIRDCKNQDNYFNPLSMYLQGKDLGPSASRYLMQCEETKGTAEEMYRIAKLIIEAAGGKLYNLDEAERSLGEKV